MIPQENTEKTKHYEFLDCEVDLDRRELRRAGNLVPVQRKVFDLLLYLIENRQRAVGKDELQDAVWPGTIVTETALTRAIMKARRAIGDDAVRQDAIKTIHGHGYRFLAELTESLSREVKSEEPAESHSLWQELRRRRVLRVGGAYAAVAWLLAQGGDIAFEAFEWSKAPLQLLLVFLVVGFPIALVLAWVYQLTPEGLKKESELPELPSIKPLVTRDRLLIGFLAVALCLSLLLNFKSLPEDEGLPFRIAIMPVASATEDIDLEWTRLGLMGLLNRVVGDGDTVSVVPARAVLSLLDENADTTDVTEELRNTLRKAYGASYVVLPRIERDNELLRLSATVISEGGETNIAGHVAADATVLARVLSQDIVSLVNPDAIVGEAQQVISDDPLANQAYAKGMEQQLKGNLEEAKRFFSAAMVLDPAGFWPRYEHALVTRILGDYKDAERQLIALLAEARAGEEPKATYSALNALGIVYMRMGKTEESEKYLLEGLAFSEKFNDPAKATSILTNLGIITKDRGEFEQSREWLQRALASYNAARIEVVPGSLYNTLANLSADEGDLDTAHDYFSKALESFQFVGNKRFEASVLNNLAWVRTRQRRFAEALVLNEEALALRQKTGDKVGVVNSQRSLTNLYLAMNDFAKAEEMANLVFESPVTEQTSNLKASALSALGRVATARGDYGTAKDKINQAIQINAERDNIPGVLDQQLKLVRVFIEAKEFNDARTISQNILNTAQKEGQGVSEVRALQMLGEVAMNQDRPQDAIDLLSDAQKRAKELNNTPLIALSVARLATVYMDNGRQADAAPLIALLEEIRPTSPDTLVLQARLAHDSGLHGDALNYLRSAKEEKGEAWNDEDETLFAEYLALVDQ